MNFFMVFLFALLSRKIIRRAKKRGRAGRIRPVIDKVFPFEQAKEALAYLEQGRAKGKVVVQMT
jgi:NADPH:quinone reductase-like Zn-dependent oxidoreductase